MDEGPSNDAANRWQIPTAKRSRLACHIRHHWIESEEFNEAAPMGFRRAVLVLLPFLDCRISNPKSKQFRQLGHGQREVDSLLAEVFSEGRWSRRVVAQSPKMQGIGGFPAT